MHIDNGVRLLAGHEERIPEAVLVVDGRQAQRERVLGEGHGERALVGAPVDLGGRGDRVPQGDKGQRDEATAPVAGAPLVDYPVVVGLDAEEGEVLILAFQKGLAAEPGQHVGEADRHVDMVLVHGSEPVGLLPTRRVDLVEGNGDHVQLVEASGCRQLGEGIDEVVVQPPVAHLPTFDPLLEREDAALKVELGRIALNPGAPVLVLRRQAGGPQVGRLHHVVVDRDDARNGRHCNS